MSGDGSHFTSDGIGLFDLAENLRLADHHAVERTGDAEEMANSFTVVVLIEVGLNIVGRDGKVFVKEADEIGFSLGLDGGGFFGVILQS